MNPLLFLFVFVSVLSIIVAYIFAIMRVDKKINEIIKKEDTDEKCKFLATDIINGHVYDKSGNKITNVDTKVKCKECNDYTYNSYDGCSKYNRSRLIDISGELLPICTSFEFPKSCTLEYKYIEPNLVPNYNDNSDWEYEQVKARVRAISIDMSEERAEELNELFEKYDKTKDSSVTLQEQDKIIDELLEQLADIEFERLIERIKLITIPLTDSSLDVEKLTESYENAGDLEEKNKIVEDLTNALNKLDKEPEKVEIVKNVGVNDTIKVIFEGIQDSSYLYWSIGILILLVGSALVISILKSPLQN